MTLSELKQRVFQITKTESVLDLKVERPELLLGLDLRKKASWLTILERAKATQPIESEPEATTVITSESIEPEPILDAYRSDSITEDRDNEPNILSRLRECFNAEIRHNQRVFKSLWSMAKNAVGLNLRQPVLIVQSAF